MCVICSRSNVAPQILQCFFMLPTCCSKKKNSQHVHKEKKFHQWQPYSYKYWFYADVLHICHLPKNKTCWEELINQCRLKSSSDQGMFFIKFWKLVLLFAFYFCIFVISIVLQKKISKDVKEINFFKWSFCSFKILEFV